MPYLASTFPTFSSESLEIQPPRCHQNSIFFSRYTHRAKGRGKLTGKKLGMAFSFTVFNLETESRYLSSELPLPQVLCAFLIPIWTVAISSGTVSFEDPLGQNGGRTSHWKCERAMLCLVSCTSHILASR